MHLRACPTQLLLGLLDICWLAVLVQKLAGYLSSVILTCCVQYSVDRLDFSGKAASGYYDTVPIAVCTCRQLHLLPGEED